MTPIRLLGGPFHGQEVDIDGAALPGRLIEIEGRPLPHHDELEALYRIDPGGKTAHWDVA